MSKTVSETGLRAITHVYAGNSFGPSSEGVILPKEGIGTDSDAGRDWRKEEKGTTEDEMAGWHHRLDGCEFE